MNPHEAAVVEGKYAPVQTPVCELPGSYIRHIMEQYSRLKNRAFAEQIFTELKRRRKLAASRN